MTTLKNLSWQPVNCHLLMKVLMVFRRSLCTCNQCLEIRKDAEDGEMLLIRNFTSKGYRETLRLGVTNTRLATVT